MKLLTVIGTGRYDEVAYVWGSPEGEREYVSRYAPAATAHFLQPEEMILLATPEATAAHLSPLCAAVEGVSPVRVVEIPLGQEEGELWRIFALIAEQVGPGEHIALDITHGFRSLPMIALMAVCFLRAARRAEVERILYGAYEARDESTFPPRVPMFDLTPMFALLEWAVAADRFVRLGDARDLAALLRMANPPGPMQRLDPALRDLGKRLGPLAKRLDTMSLSLLLARTYDVMRLAGEVGDRLERAEEVYPAEARPFAEISAQVQGAFCDFALANPEAPQNVVGSLDRQRRLIRWYWEHQHYMQTATLAREWLISWVAAWRGEADLLNEASRSEAKDLLGQLHGSAKCGRRTSLEGVPHSEGLGLLWGKVTDVRNDLDHAGMRRGYRPADALVKDLRECLEAIEGLPLPGEDISHTAEPR